MNISENSLLYRMVTVSTSSFPLEIKNKVYKDNIELQRILNEERTTSNLDIKSFKGWQDWYFLKGCLGQSYAPQLIFEKAVFFLEREHLLGMA